MKTNTLDFDAQALREKILDLAMRGKLVPQDPNDEPASVLLEKIKAEKEQLIKEKKIKKSKPFAPITDDEKPFDIPDSWEWVRLGDVLSLENGAIRRGPFGSSLKKAFFVPKDKNTYKVYEQGNAINHTIDYGDYYISQEKYNELKSFSVRPKDIIISGAGTIGKTYILPPDTPDGVINQALIRVRLNDNLITNEFFLLAFQQKVSLLNKKAKGTAIKNMFSIAHMKNDLIWALPPLEEQSRIAAKIAQLFALLRKVESSTQQYAKLQTLLKSKVLDLAMRGKLVEQDPHDEPASVLLEKIRRDTSERILKKETQRIKIGDFPNERALQYKIPKSWIWTKLGNIIYKLSDGAHKTPEYTSDGIPFLSVKDMSSGKIDFSNCKYISVNSHKELYKRCDPQKGDIILSKVGTTGVPAIVETDRQFDLFVSVALLKFNHKYIDTKFLRYLIESPLVQQQAQKNTRGVGNKNWVLRDIAGTVVPLPSLSEQIQIANKLEKVFSLLN